MSRASRVALAVLLQMLAMVAMAQVYPSKPIKLIVPFAAAGGTDIVARALAAKLSARLGQPIIIENKPGAGGNIGAGIVAKAPADGYTLLVGTVGTHAINASLYSPLPFDPVKDFSPILLLSSVSSVLAVHPSFPGTSLEDVVRAAKSKPGELTFGSSGTGTTPHLAGELLKSMAHVQITHVPYKGGGPMYFDLLSGQLNMGFGLIASALPHIQAGKLRAIAVTSKTRSRLLPEVPTFSESGLPGFDATGWNAVFAPAGTPKAVVDKLSREINVILSSLEMRKLLEDQGAEAGGGTPEELASYVRAETLKWAEIVKQSGARAD